VAAAKLARQGTSVHLVGRVGDDDFGQRLLNGLSAHHVDTRHVTVSEGTPSGAAVILVDQQGENTIIVAAGANTKVSTRDVDRAESLIAGATAVVVQMEIPADTVSHVIAMCRRLGVYVILDPAPVPPGGLGASFFAVDVLAPNEHEAEALLHDDVNSAAHWEHPDDVKIIGSRLLSRGAKAVALKRGRRGALLMDRAGTIESFEGFKAKVVDTTAAGDAFVGALAVGRAEGMELLQAVRFANAAGAACCESFGAQPALPTRQAVERQLEY